MSSNLQQGAKFDLHIHRNRPFRQSFVVCSITEKPIALTEYAFKAQVRKERSSDAELLAEFAISVPNPATGEVVLSLTQEQTAALPQGTRPVYWDLYMEYPNGFNCSLLQGLAYFDEIVTVPDHE